MASSARREQCSLTGGRHSSEEISVFLILAASSTIDIVSNLPTRFRIKISSWLWCELTRLSLQQRRQITRACNGGTATKRFEPRVGNIARLLIDLDIQSDHIPAGRRTDQTTTHVRILPVQRACVARIVVVIDDFLMVGSARRRRKQGQGCRRPNRTRGDAEARSGRDGTRRAESSSD